MKFLRDSFRDFLTISGFFLRLRDFYRILFSFWGPILGFSEVA